MLKHGNEGLFGDGRILSLAKGLNQWIRTQNGINDDPETRGLEYTDSQQPRCITQRQNAMVSCDPVVDVSRC